MLVQGGIGDPRVLPCQRLVPVAMVGVPVFVCVWISWIVDVWFVVCAFAKENKTRQRQRGARTPSTSSFPLCHPHNPHTLPPSFLPVQDRHPPAPQMVQRVSRRHDAVVEDAEPLRLVPRGVVPGGPRQGEGRAAGSLAVVGGGIAVTVISEQRVARGVEPGGGGEEAALVGREVGVCGSVVCWVGVGAWVYVCGVSE